MTDEKDKPCWELCEMCDDFLCNVHVGQHAHDCECEPIEWWEEKEMYPYTTTVREYEKIMNQ
jgi:hypothetical protein